MRISIIEIDDFTLEQRNAAIQNGCGPSGAFFAYLTAVRLTDVSGSTEYDRGTVEGMRALAKELQDIVLMKDKPLEVKTNRK